MPRVTLTIAAVSCLVAVQPVWAQNVKVTPLGSHDGEFCARDRALVFEDPDGTRILYDAGRTVRGPDDERLGEIDAVLLSHVHGDHLGDVIASAQNAGTCGSPDQPVSVTPNSNSVNIVIGKNAKFLVGGEMGSFFQNKIKGAGGDPALVQLVRFGGEREVGGVKVASVPAVHSNGISPDFLEGDLADQLKASGLTAYVGPPGGYVLQFSNGLVVYLSGDTGITAEQDAVVRQHFGAKLAVARTGTVSTTRCSGSPTWTARASPRSSSTWATRASATCSTTPRAATTGSMHGRRARRAGTAIAA
jgi:L-ascorbate metabolism protein UlaG (beta-lactamase superfamily)